jgi:Tfp pilus assembly protein PilW
MNFVAGSIIRWNGTFRQPTSVTSTALTTDLTSADLALAGFASVSVDNPLPGGIVASSVSVDFLINSSKGSNTSAPQVISVNASGGPANGASAAPAISDDGRFVAFYSEARDLVREGASGNIFVRDICLGSAKCTPHTLAVDLAPNGSAPNARASDQIAMSADGRFVAFASWATNLAVGTVQSVNAGSTAADGDWKLSLFVHDTCAGTNVPAGCMPHTELLASGVNGPRYSRFSPSLSADGRYVALVLGEPGSALGEPGNQTQVNVRDTCAGPTASVACVPKTIGVIATPTSRTGDVQAFQAKISSTGRYLAITTRRVGGTKTDGRIMSQIFLWDLCLGTDAPAACSPSELEISVAPDGTALGGLNAEASLSADARFVVFESRGSGSGGSESSPQNIFLRDTCLGATASDSCVPSTALIYSQNPPIEGASQSLVPSISPSGRFISFVANGSGPDLVKNEAGSLFIHDTCFGARTVCTPATYPNAGAGADLKMIPLMMDKITPVPLTADGRYAVYHSRAADDSAAPVSGLGDVFLVATPFK